MTERRILTRCDWCGNRIEAASDHAPDCAPPANFTGLLPERSLTFWYEGDPEPAR